MIVIYEGCDMVGKSTFISMNEIISPYHPSYSLFDKLIDRNNAVTIGLSIIDYYVKCCNTNEFDLIFDRGFPSSIVYSKMYPNEKSLTNDQVREILSYLSSIPCGIQIWHIEHKDKDTARKFYEASQLREDNEKFDKFNSFEEYWEFYNKMNSKFHEFYEELENESYKNIAVSVIKNEWRSQL